MRVLHGLIAVMLMTSAAQAGMPRCLVDAVEQATCTARSKETEFCGVTTFEGATLLVFEINRKVPMPMAQASSFADYLMRNCGDWIATDEWADLLGQRGFRSSIAVRRFYPLTDWDRRLQVTVSTAFPASPVSIRFGATLLPRK